jgi:hypothetical protein
MQRNPEIVLFRCLAAGPHSNIFNGPAAIFGERHHRGQIPHFLDFNFDPMTGTQMTSIRKAAAGQVKVHGVARIK